MEITIRKLRTPALVTSSEVTALERWHNLVAIWSGARLYTRAHDEVRLVAYGFRPDTSYTEGRGVHSEVMFSKVIRKKQT